MDGLTWQQTLAALATIVASWLVSRSGIRAKRIESAASPYERLAERVVTLEGQVDKLREEVRTLRDANDELREDSERAHELAAQQGRLAGEADDYITDLHTERLTRLGPSPIHRMRFVNVRRAAGLEPEEGGHNGAQTVELAAPGRST